MLKLWRSRPLEPPSSVTVTTAARSEMRQGGSAAFPPEECGDATYRRSPRNRVERPVPPPIATARMLDRSVILRPFRVFATCRLGNVGETDFIEQSQGYPTRGS